jgi:hypothetical protein
VDGDGDGDLFLTALGPDLLLRNDDGVFVDVTEAAGVAGDPDGWSTAATFLDADGDGDADLFVKKGGVPTSTDHDGKSEGALNEETVWLPDGAGTYWVRVLAADEFAMASLKAKVTR